MRKLLFVTAGVLAFAIGMTGVGRDAQAGLIEVSQESSVGAGDFDANVLGFINPFSTGLTGAGFYQYSSPNVASYNGETNGGPTPVSSLTQVFLVEASDGLTLMVVHDKAGDGTGGSTQTRWVLTGDTAAQVQADDPGEAVMVSMGGMQFDSTKNWIGCCTDGYAIGALMGDWALFGQFLFFNSGITNWAVISSDFSSINLVLANNLNVRLRPVPEPGTLAICIIGLVGLGFFMRRRRRVA